VDCTPVQAFSRGQPIMSDEDYDELKNTLKNRASVITAQVRVAAPTGAVKLCEESPVI